MECLKDIICAILVLLALGLFAYGTWIVANENKKNRR